ncbi:MAG: PD-(D/E)XK nuclease family protein [Erysipelotrichaceae bacterium]|nr:PD-(D/E)XK nuclease family protein [Erysipelotrichaceae bacterium]
MKTILTPTYLQQAFTQTLLKQTKTPYLINTNIISLEVFLSNFFHNEDTNNYELSQCIKEVNVTFFKKMLYFQSFIDEIISFTRLIKSMDVALEDLPQDTLMNQELYRLVESIYHKPLLQDNYKDYQKRLDHTFQEVEILYPSPTFLQKKIIDFLVEKQATILKLQQYKTPKENLYHTVNTRYEVECIAQDIIKHNYLLHDVNVIITDTQYQNIIKEVFHRYQLDYSFTILRQKDMGSYHLANLLELYQTRDLTTLLKICMDQTLKTSSFVITYIKDYVKDFEDCFKPFMHYQTLKLETTLFPYEDLIELEKEAEFSFVCFRKDVLNILNSPSFEDALTASFEYLKKYHPLKRTKQFIEQHLELLNQPEQLIHRLHNHHYHLYEDYSNCICVTDLNHPVDARKMSYVIGLDQNHYPAYKEYSGYFNEEYLAKTPFIDNQQRYQLHMKNLEWIFHSGQSIYYFYPMSSYTGKAIELSYHIETRIKKNQEYPIIQNNNSPLSFHYLNKDTAKELFFKQEEDNLYLDGSISSFEQYFHCPYKYYLNQGLKLKERQYLRIDSSIIGTILHYVLEHLTTTYKQKYTKHLEQAFVLVEQCCSDLKQLLPKDDYFIPYVQQQINHLLKNVFLFLDAFEQTSKLIPKKAEYTFENVVLKLENAHLRLRGKIDRIDYNSSFYRVIDYKSSNLKLSPSLVHAGLQLQLLTYSYILSLKDYRQAFGNYYLALNKKTFEYVPYTYGKDKVQKNTMEYPPNFQKHKVSGFTYVDKKQYEQECSLISTSKYTSMDFEVIKFAIPTIYQYLIDSLLDGDIDVRPVNNACTYCPYKSICRHFQPSEKPNPIFKQAFMINSEEEEEDIYEV